MERNSEAEAVLRWSKCHPKIAKVMYWIEGTLMLGFLGLTIAAIIWGIFFR